MKHIIVFFAVLSLLLTACGSDSAVQGSVPQEASAPGSTPTVTMPDVSSLFTDRDYRTDYTLDTTITLSGSTASVDGKGAAVSGSTITITDEGVYLITGTLENGMIIVDTDKQSKVQLVLDGAQIQSNTSAAVYVRQADKVFITTAQDSQNILSNGGTFEAIDENNIDAAIFSKDDLTLNGSGSLTVTSPAGHGIVSKDELTVTGGSYHIQAAAHGLNGKDNVCVDGSVLTIHAGKDGIQADNDADAALGFVYIASGSLQIEAEGDGISASSCVCIDGGSFDILTGGGSVNGEVHTSDNWGHMGGMRPGNIGGRPGGMGGKGDRVPDNIGSTGTAETTAEDSTSIKGIKAATVLLINDGSFTIDSADDALHSNGDLTVNGGIFSVSSGDDGLHADAALRISAGTITITESYEGLEGLSITLSGADVTLKASDDGLNAAGGNDQSGFGGSRGGDRFAANADSFILISGGTLFVDASGDGIDSNGNLTVTGGYTIVEGPTGGGNGPLDYAGSASISGGTLIVTGSIQMAQSITADGQGVLGLSVGNQTGGTAWKLLDTQGNVILFGQPAKAYSCLVISCPDMISGETYTIQVGDISGQMTAE